MYVVRNWTSTEGPNGRASISRCRKGSKVATSCGFCAIEAAVGAARKHVCLLVPRCYENQTMFTSVPPTKV